uniref:Uncharacterized protein n=1 Tax=Arundo donax TaxID=35708 RepID=A0A0A9QHF5_ARUDO
MVELGNLTVEICKFDSVVLAQRCG